MKYTQGERVWLSRKFIRTRRPSQKLDFRRIGPFPVDCMIGKNAVRLILPNEYLILHPVFNVSLIMPYFSGSSHLSEKENTNDIYDAQALKFITDWVAVELIIDHRFKDSSHEYLLRAAIHSGTEDDFCVSLDNITKAMDPFIQ